MWHSFLQQQRKCKHPDRMGLPWLDASWCQACISPHKAWENAYIFPFNWILAYYYFYTNFPLMSQVGSEYTQKHRRSFPVTARTLRLWVKQGLDVRLLSPLLTHRPVAYCTWEKCSYLPSAFFPHHSAAKNTVSRKAEKPKRLIAIVKS